VLALDLFRTLARSPGNLFVSPHGIATALAMVAAGARGRTRDELTRVLETDDAVTRYERLGRELATRSEPTPHDLAMAKYMTPAPPPDSYGCTLAIANALWHQRGYTLASAYVAELEQRLGATTSAVDFAGGRSDAVCAINAWVTTATRERIQHVLDDVAPATRVVLANAIYFKARWATQFEPTATRPAPFFAPRGAITVPTMYHLAHYRHARLADATAIELPYSGGAIAMLVVVPDADALPAVERALDVDRLEAALAVRHIQLALPKFRVQSRFQLREPLAELGVVDAFSHTADFSAVSSEPGFALDEVVHQTYVDVDERGTEAAAVTMAMLAGSAMPRDILQVRVDRPFLFVIRDLPTKTVLFIGRVEDPR
jgi:serpin B